MKEMYVPILEKMKEDGIKVLEGIEKEQLEAAEECFGIRFPGELVEFYLTGMPVGRRFPDWTDLSEENVKRIRKSLRFPEMSVRNENEDQFPQDAVPLIPVYGHKYMPVIEGLEDGPIISVYGLDIIYSGRNLLNFLEIKFLGKDPDTIWEDAVAVIPGWEELIS